MIKDPDFADCGFVKTYFALTAQRPDEIIITFVKGKFNIPTAVYIFQSVMFHEPIFVS